MFPKHIPGLPPEKEIDFEIHLVLGTTPISLPPSQMVSRELKELKEKLHDLVDKGLVHPNVSQWEHQFCSRKGKMIQ